MKDLKYLLAYIPPILSILGLLWLGWWSFSAILFAFVLIPLIEPIMPSSTQNFSPEEKNARLKDKFFDILLYLNLPLVYFIVGLFLYKISLGVMETYELIGNLVSVGLIIGAGGINVGHELGHRVNTFDRTLSKMLLLPALYMHFFIEHNRGHHKNVATPLDPASADRGEILYFFWIKSLVGGYINAWRLESKRLQAIKLPVFSLHNQMLKFQLIQLGYLLGVYALFGGFVTFIAIVAALHGILNLETVNYIEHYGLRRKLLPSGKYERVMPKHSWNANYEVGRIMLYELTRHSDHHYMASKKYQVLDHHDESPELPFGYPAAMILSFVPPLWFWVMDRKLTAFEGAAKMAA